MEHDDEDDDDGDDADAHGVEVAKYQSYQYIIVGRQASTHLLGHRGVPVWSTSQLLQDHLRVVNPRLKILPFWMVKKSFHFSKPTNRRASERYLHRRNWCTGLVLFVWVVVSWKSPLKSY